MMRWALVALAACGGKAATPPVGGVGPRTKPGASRAACVTPSDEVAAIAHATASGTRVQYCIGKATTECFALDVGSGLFERLTETPKSLAANGHAHVETTNPRLEVCVAGACKALTAKVLPSSTTLRATTNTDGTFAVVLLGDAPKGKGYAEVWDVTNTKRAATFRYARGDFRCGEVAMLDDATIYVNAIQCGQPAARGGLYKLDGRKIANVGGKDFGTFGGAFVQVEGAKWAFLEENANKLVIQDIVKGKVEKTIDTTSLFKNGGAEMGNPGESALVKLADGKLAVIAGAPATGSVATIDITTGDLKLVPAPLCK